MVGTGSYNPSLTVTSVPWPHPGPGMVQEPAEEGQAPQRQGARSQTPTQTKERSKFNKLQRGFRNRAQFEFPSHSGYGHHGDQPKCDFHDNRPHPAYSDWYCPHRYGNHSTSRTTTPTGCQTRIITTTARRRTFTHSSVCNDPFSRWCCRRDGEY